MGLSAFIVDMIGYVNEVDKRPQRKDQFINKMDLQRKCNKNFLNSNCVQMNLSISLHSLLKFEVNDLSRYSILMSDEDYNVSI